VCVDLTGEGPVRAIRLWSDWNVDVSHWAQQHEGDDNFSYLRIRTEDLVSKEEEGNWVEEEGFRRRREEDNNNSP